MTSQAVERTWIHMGGYGRLRGECVNQKTYKSSLPIFSPDFASNSQIRPFFNAEKKIFLKMLGTLLKTKFNRLFFFNRMVSNTQKNSQLFWNKFFSQGFICRQENATAVLDGFLDFDIFLSTAALLTQLIFSVGRGEKRSKSNQNRKRSSLESSFRSELLFRDHSRSMRQFALVKQERFCVTKVFKEKCCRELAKQNYK